MTTTLDAIKTDAGVQLVFCVTIEGVPWILTSGSAAAAVTAYAGTGYSSALGGLVLRWGDGQAMKPWGKDLSVPLMSFGVQPEADGSDTFGKMVGASAGGVETKLTASLDLNDTTINVLSTAGAWDGEIHIGTERITYSGTTATSFTGCTRGTYPPFEMDIGNLPRIHSLPDYSDQVTLKPFVTSQPRTWVGRWVAIYAHRVVAGVLDTRAEAHRVFAGKIVGTSEDEVGWTWVEVEDLRGAIRDCMLLRDQFVADVKDGVYLQAGAVFDCGDFYTGGTQKNANALTVVASGAVAPNEIDAGVYTHDEICGFLNRWLAAEETATRLNSRITFGLVQTDQGYRTQVQVFRSSASAISVKFLMPNDVWRFLGWTWSGWQPFDVVGSSGEALSQQEPYRRMLTYGQVPGDGSIVVETEREVGTFFDNREWFPSDFGTLDTGETWGVVQVSDGGLLLVRRTVDGFAIIGSEYGIATLRQISGRDETSSPAYTVRMSESGPLTVKQVAIIAGPFDETVLRFLASTGTASVNGDFDVLPAQLGAAIPVDVLGTLETDLGALQAGETDELFVIEKPVKLWERLQGDFLARAAMLVVKNGALRCAAWSTPTAATALHDLTEDNKAEPAGTVATHRTVPVEDDSFTINVVKLEYNRALSGGNYRSSITLVDTAAMEEMGERPITIQLPNLFAGVANGTATVDAIAGYISGWMPLFSRPLRVLRRSVNRTLYEDIAPGDHVALSDLFVRDTTTGERGVTGKPGLILKHRASYGGKSQGGDIDSMLGEVDILIYPRDRISTYCPCAEVDETALGGGYSYNAIDDMVTLTFKDHAHTSSAFATVDLDHFSVGDEVVIVEIDPAVAGSPLSWERTIDEEVAPPGVSFTGELVGFDSTKQYRMISQTYSAAAAQQKAKVYQADDADELIEDLAAAYEYGWQASNITSWTDDTPGSVQAALYSTLAYGDGKPLDTGYERDIARLVNSLTGYRTAPSQPCLFHGAVSAAGGVVRTIVMMLPVQCGEGDLLAGDRYLYVRPEYASKGGSTTLRVSLCRALPIGTSRTITDADAPPYVLVGPYETATWTTSSTTLSVDAAYAFSAKSLDGNGEGWLVVEVDPNGSFRGLAEVRWGPYSRAA